MPRNAGGQPRARVNRDAEGWNEVRNNRNRQPQGAGASNRNAGRPSAFTPDNSVVFNIQVPGNPDVKNWRAFRARQLGASMLRAVQNHRGCATIYASASTATTVARIQFGNNAEFVASGLPALANPSATTTLAGCLLSDDAMLATFFAASISHQRALVIGLKPANAAARGSASAAAATGASQPAAGAPASNPWTRGPPRHHSTGGPPGPNLVNLLHNQDFSFVDSAATGTTVSVKCVVPGASAAPLADGASHAAVTARAAYMLTRTQTTEGARPCVVSTGDIVEAVMARLGLFGAVLADFFTQVINAMAGFVTQLHPDQQQQFIPGCPDADFDSTVAAAVERIRQLLVPILFKLTLVVVDTTGVRAKRVLITDDQSFDEEQRTVKVTYIGDGVSDLLALLPGGAPDLATASALSDLAVAAGSPLALAKTVLSLHAAQVGLDAAATESWLSNPSCITEISTEGSRPVIISIGGSCVTSPNQPTAPLFPAAERRRVAAAEAAARAAQEAARQQQHVPQATVTEMQLRAQVRTQQTQLSELSAQVTHLTRTIAAMMNQPRAGRDYPPHLSSQGAGQHANPSALILLDDTGAGTGLGTKRRCPDESADVSGPYVSPRLPTASFKSAVTSGLGNPSRASAAPRSDAASVPFTSIAARSAADILEDLVLPPAPPLVAQGVGVGSF